MPDLITLSRATQNPTLAALAASGPAYLASLITTASDSIRRVCSRDFTLGTYSEYRSGGIYIREPLRLRQFPVVEISRVACSPLPALLVQNVDSITNQRASVETTATSLRLIEVASAVTTVAELLYSTHPTINSLTVAINALGNGWNATVRNDFGNWASSDFKPLQGAVSVLSGGRDLEMYAEIIQPFSVWRSSPDQGSDEGDQGSTGWRLDEETGELYGRFPRGQLNIRIDYQAGFATVPQPVQEACVQLAQDLYQAGLVNNTLKKARLGASSVELKSSTGSAQMSPKVAMLLAPFRDYAKAISR